MSKRLYVGNLAFHSTEDSVRGAFQRAGVEVLGVQLMKKISNKQLVIIMFSATWCGPCSRLKPQYEQLCQSKKKSLFYCVDIDKYEDSELCSYYQMVDSVPTFMLFMNNALVSSPSFPDLESEINKYEKIIYEKKINDVIKYLSAKGMNNKQIKETINEAIK